MLTTGARAEVLTSHEDAALVLRVVKDKVLVHATVCVVSPVAKQVVAKELFLLGGRLQEAGGDYLVSINVL